MAFAIGRRKIPCADLHHRKSDREAKTVTRSTRCNNLCRPIRYRNCGPLKRNWKRITLLRLLPGIGAEGLFTLFFFFSLWFIAVLSLLYSHRTAGPLYRIKKCVDSFVEKKDTGPIKLRKHDEFKDLAASLEKLRNGFERERGVRGG